MMVDGPKTSSGASTSAGERLQFNPGDLKLVPAEKREFWEKLKAEVALDIADRFRAKWTRPETTRVVVATPDETYEDVARELGRTPGAVRFRRQAMIHLLRDEHKAHQKVAAYLEDPKKFHKYADYWQVHEVIDAHGYYDLSVSEQFSLAVPLGQPSGSWRGDGTSAAIARRLRDHERILQLLKRTGDKNPGSS